MTNWKKITVGIMSACLAVTCVPGVSEIGGFVHTKTLVQAATTDLVVSGKCGEKASWEYNRDTKVLTIGGAGEIQSYKSEAGMLYTKDGSRFVWCPEQKEGKVTIATGTAIIGTDAFYGCDKVTDIVIPDTVKTIEKQAFGNVENDCKMNAVVFWVPAGKLEFYKKLLTSETGFWDGMVIKEVEE